MILKDYTKEQIINLIVIIKECVRENRYTISLDGSKLENLQFIEEYNINEDKCINILFNLEEEDFCYGLKNMNDGILKNNLYVFCPKKVLYNIEGKKEDVDVYLRFKIIEDEAFAHRIIVSMHKRNKPITYILK